VDKLDGMATSQDKVRRNPENRDKWKRVDKLDGMVTSQDKVRRNPENRDKWKQSKNIMSWRSPIAQ
jgi:hypothetical protein